MSRSTSSPSLPSLHSLPLLTAPAGLRPEARAAVRPRLSPRALFTLVASIPLSFLAGSAAPTPLYAVYQAAWGFSPVTVTIVFGVYAIAVLATLVTVGALSDQIGRRPVLLATTALQALAMLIFAAAGDVTTLIVARVVQGLSTGAAAGAAGAAMLDLDRVRGTTANAVAPMIGSATGALASGLMVQYLPAPTHLVYVVMFLVFVAQLVGLSFAPETIAVRQPVNLSSLLPRLRVPRGARRTLLMAAPVLIAAWALPGFYGSLGPALVRSLVGSHGPALGGLTLFLMAGSGVVTVLLMRERSGRVMLTVGASALVVGVGLTLVGMTFGSNATFFAGTAIAGVGFGAGFHGAVRSVVPLVSASERAGVLAVLFTLAYLAMGLPAVVAGLGVVHGGGLRATAQQYGVGIIVLGAAALLARLPPPAAAWRRPPEVG